jgi:transposase
MEFSSVPFLFMMTIKNGQLPHPLKRGSCPSERNLILMANDISFLTGINDPNLKMDKSGVENIGNYKVIHLVKTGTCYCPVCGRPMLKNGYRRQPVKILALPIANVPTILLIRKQKYICKPSSQCPETVTKIAEINGINHGCRIANNVKQAITLDLRRNESQKDIGEQYYVSPSTVGRIIDSLEDNFTPEKSWLPNTIAFDDFKSGRFAPSGMSMILMNPVNHRTIDIIPSRTSRAFRQYFYRHFTRRSRLSVSLVVIDLYGPYRRLIRELFPNARIIADHFHVVVQAYRALQSIRIKTMNHYGPGTHEYRALKRFWKLLLQKLSLLDNIHYQPRRNFRGAWLTNSEVIDRLLAMSEELRIAYNYYQTLVDAVDHENQGELQSLLQRKLTSLPFKLQKVQRTLRQHQNEIIRSFRHHLSNGPIEGTNNKIKVIKRTAYGFRNFFHFRVRILMALKNPHIMVGDPQKTKISSSSLAA